MGFSAGATRVWFHKEPEVRRLALELWKTANVDARMLAELTHVPTLVWGVLWIVIAIAVSWWLLSRTYRRT